MARELDYSQQQPRYAIEPESIDGGCLMCFQGQAVIDLEPEIHLAFSLNLQHMKVYCKTALTKVSRAIKSASIAAA